MEVVLVRHGIAEPPGPDGDAARPLTAEGRERFAAAVRGLSALGLRAERVVSSPLLRAVQTAELLRPLLDDGRAPEVDPALARPPDGALLAACTDRTILVGHEPWMSELLALACFGGPGPAAGIRFGKGATAWLAGEPRPGRMVLRALWPARTLARAVGALGSS